MTNEEMPEERIANGRFEWMVRYRRIRGDEGISVRLLGPVQHHTCELARFDCFYTEPHYHIAFYNENKITMIDDKEDSFGYVRRQVADHLANLVSQCGGDEPTVQECSNHAQTLRSLGARVRHITATHRPLV